MFDNSEPCHVDLIWVPARGIRQKGETDNTLLKLSEINSDGWDGSSVRLKKRRPFFVFLTWLY